MHVEDVYGISALQTSISADNLSHDVIVSLSLALRANACSKIIERISEYLIINKQPELTTPKVAQWQKDGRLFTNVINHDSNVKSFKL